MSAKYRVKDSSHREDGVTYMKGEIVETECDLVLMFGPDKFEYISGTPTKTGKHKPFNPRDLLKAKATVKKDSDRSEIQTSTAQHDDGDEDDEVDFSAMTVADLHKYAAEQKIDLQGAKTKADIIKVLSDE